MKKYRPSNGTEGSWFYREWCHKCVRDVPESEKYCSIIGLTHAYGIDDPEYPAEWIHDDEDAPICTAFTTNNPPTKSDIAYLKWKGLNNGLD